MKLERMDVIWDMETGDPDDFITLVFLLGHPLVNLLAVTVTPGGADQVGLVRWALKMFEVEDKVRVGSFHQPAALASLDKKNKGEVINRVSKWHYKVYGDGMTWVKDPPIDDPNDIQIRMRMGQVPPIERSNEAEHGPDLLWELMGENTTLITGGPLKNLGKMLLDKSLLLFEQTPRLGKLVVQGGFAGDNVVPKENRLPKFDGKITCPTYNLNGDPQAALRLLEKRHWFQDLRFVSKNVCHGVAWTPEIHELYGEVLTEVLWNGGAATNLPHITELLKEGALVNLMDTGTPLQEAGSPWGLAMKLIYLGMDRYLEKKPGGKALHDPLAAACALNNDIGEWVEVEMYREKGQWGARLQEGSGVRIIIDYYTELFIEALLAWHPDVGGLQFPHLEEGQEAPWLSP